MRLLVLTLGAALLAATPATADSGRSGMSTSSPLANVRAMNELRDFGVCFARRQRDDALAIIATEPGSGAESAALREHIYGEHDGCLFGGTNMQIPNVFARGAIAEGLQVWGRVPDNLVLTAPAPEEVKDLHGVARCYADRHRGEVHALLETRPGSAEERAAVAALWGDFQTCMPRLGARLNAPWIRFLLAEALLRLPSNSPASGG